MHTLGRFLSPRSRMGRSRVLLTGFFTGLLLGSAISVGLIVISAQQPQTRIEQFLIRTQGTTTGVTAATTQTQGQGAITTSIVQVSTVGTANDVVTLPTAIAGDQVLIINDGVNDLQIFPASGDDLGAGVNLSTTLESNESMVFVAYDATNWEVESTSEIKHAEMVDVDNTDAFLIVDAGGDSTLYHTNGLAAGDLAGWTFDAGGGGTSFPIASIADSPGSSGAQAQITTTGSHLLAAGDIVSLSNLSAGSNAGLFVVTAPVTATTFEIISTNSTDATGTMDQAATLTADTGSAGDYLVLWSASGTAESNNDIFEFHVAVNAADASSTAIRRKFAIGADIGAMSGVSIVAIADADKVSFDLANVTAGTGDITLRDFTLVLIRL